LPSQKAKLYQYRDGEINFTGPPFFTPVTRFTLREVTSMTDQEREAIRRALEEQTRLHKASPAEARAFLLKSGVYTAKGELTPEYGGPSPKSTNRRAAS
jgi:hypothetical protein